MNNTQKKHTRTERKQMMVRIVCMAIAVVMVGSAIISAILSQVY